MMIENDQGILKKEVKEENLWHFGKDRLKRASNHVVRRSHPCLSHYIMQYMDAHVLRGVCMSLQLAAKYF